jgi:hypothetical protein
MTARRTQKPSVQEAQGLSPVIEVSVSPRRFKIDLQQVLKDLTDQIYERVNEDDDPTQSYAEYVLYGKDFITEMQ